MSSLYRLKFLDVSITLWVILALNWLAAGCGGDGPTELPDASRDRIIFASQASGNFDLYTVDQSGANLVQLTSTTAFETSPAPSPDGSRIAYVSDLHGPFHIFAMNADGTGVTQLTSVAGPFTGHALSPSWSPDGTKLVFTAYTSQTADLFTMNPDGTGQVNLTNDPRQDEQGAWSPTGSGLRSFAGMEFRGDRISTSWTRTVATCGSSRPGTTTTCLRPGHRILGRSCSTA